MYEREEDRGGWEAWGVLGCGDVRNWRVLVGGGVGSVGGVVGGTDRCLLHPDWTSVSPQRSRCISLLGRCLQQISLFQS